MYKIKLSKEEEEILKKHRASSPLVLIRDKATCILLTHREISREDVGYVLHRSERTVRRWIAGFAEKRLASLFSGHENNENASKLTREQKQQIKNTLSKSPSEQDLPKEFWDVPQLKEYVNAEFGTVYESDQSYYFLLKFSGLSYKYPDKVSPRRDEHFTDKRMKEIRTEIKPLLADSNWEVFAADETRLEKQSEIRRAWLKKGERTVVKTERSKEHQNYLGFLNQKNGECGVYEIDRGNTEETIRVLRELIKKYPNKKICIVWDNARWHRSKGLRELLGKGNEFENIHLIWLPPYSPEHNPIEHVWGWAKDQIANRSSVSMKDLKEEFLENINSRNFDYKL